MLSNRTVDVGASDAPMTDQQLADAPGKILHFPSVMGADVVAYNLPGFTGTLRLTGPVIADIYSAKITKWDDDKIKALNPSAAIPTGRTSSYAIDPMAAARRTFSPTICRRSARAGRRIWAKELRSSGRPDSAARATRE